MPTEEKIGRWQFSIHQNGMKVASGCGPDEQGMRREASHYGFMYGQDGPVTVKVWRTKPRRRAGQASVSGRE